MIAIIDYDAGNTRSVINALKRIGVQYQLTDDAEMIHSADKVIFPGVGHAFTAMKRLQEKNLVEIIKSCSQPFLGICLGMQLLFEHSEEGNTTCLEIIPGKVKGFVAEEGFKVPHMGWNDNIMFNSNECILFKGLDRIETYFVHSYYAELGTYTTTLCNYGIDFTASVRLDNFFGVQFHPEKSGKVGEQILKNFINI